MAVSVSSQCSPNRQGEGWLAKIHPPLLSLPPPLSPRALDSEPTEELLVPAQGPVELLAVTDQFATHLEQQLTPNHATAAGFAAFGAFIDAPVCAYRN